MNNFIVSPHFSKMNSAKIYNEFNKGIYKHFFNEEKRGETLFFVIDEQFIQSFCDEEDLDEVFRHIRNSHWRNDFFSQYDDIPRYLGFLAVQVYAASLMENDEDYTLTFLPLSWRGRTVLIGHSASFIA